MAVLTDGDQFPFFVDDRIYCTMCLSAASHTNVCAGLAVECICIDCISSRNGLSAIPAYYGVGTIVAFDFAGIREVFSTTDTARLRANCHENIIRRTSENREISVIIVISIMGAVICSQQMLEKITALFFEDPQIRAIKTSRHCFLHDSSVLIHRLVIVLGIESRLKEISILKEEHFTVNLRVAIEVIFYVVVNDVKDHADLIAHIG